MRYATIGIWFALACSLTVVSAQKVTRECDEVDGWSLSEANFSIGTSAIGILGVIDCSSAADRDNCADIMEGLLRAEDHLIFLLQQSEKNGCMTCFLNNALESALSLDEVADDLYALNYWGVNRISKRASFRISDMMDKNCPDLEGNWYTNNNLKKVSIVMKYSAEYGLFEAELSDGVTTEFTYVQVTGYNSVKIYNSNDFGRIYNNGNNINWVNHEWIRVNNTIDGRWTMDGDVFTIKEIAKGQYQLIVVSFSPSRTHGFKHNPGDVFCEFWTEDYVHFSGFVYTKDLIAPKAPMFLKFEDGVFYINDSRAVFDDKRGASVMSKG